MYGTAATMITHLSVVPAFQEGLYTPEKHLFYLAMQTFIYEYRKSIGILSAYAEPFYLPTEENQHKKDIKKEASVQNNDTENTSNIQNDTTKQVKTPVSTKERISTQKEHNVIEEDWVQVKRNAKTRVVREAIQEAYIKNMKNRYAALKVDKEVVDEKDDKKKFSVFKKSAEVQRITYNVDDITVDEMLQHVNDYKKNDVIANIPKLLETMQSTCEKIKENVKHDCNEESYHIEEISTEMLKNEIDQQLLNDKKIEREVLHLNSLASEEEDTLDCSTDKDSSGDWNDGTMMNEQMKRIRYQNDLLLFRLEQLKDTEKHLKNDIQAMKEEASKEEILYIKKIAALESALKKKTELLINALREKG